MKNIIYVKSINEIGGIESFVYELCKKLKDMSLEVVYEKIHPKQLKRLEKYVKCVKYNKKKIKCNVALFNYDLDIIDNVDAKKYIQVIHFDFLGRYMQGWVPPVSEKINEYYAVSERSANNFTEVTGIPCKCFHLPITIEKEPKVMHLVSAQRFGLIKGDDRVKKMVKMLDESDIPYIWHIFTDSKLKIKSPNVVLMEPRMDIRKYIKDSDYTVLLSDSEGWSYLVYESLCLGIPVIATKLPVYYEEMGLNKTNSILVDFDLSDLDVNEIYLKKDKFKFKYKPINDNWKKLLGGKK